MKMSHCKLLIVLSTLLLSIEMSLSDEWSECSRSCGTGISYRMVNHSTGTKREYKVCNVQDCPANGTDFRTKQCQEVKQHSISLTSDTCKLICGLPGEPPVEKGTTVDGTPCGVSGICIEGTCVPMGCDGLIGSIRSIDKCGRCGVTEGPCLHVPCNIKKGDGQENVHHVTLPAESSHIKLLLKSSACKFLALRGQNKTFYFNQTSSIALSGNEFEFSGNKLTTNGPLHGEVLIQVKHCQTHEIRCNYYIPVHQHKPAETIFIGADTTDYAWVVGENYTPCSRSCGTGTQTSVVYCKNLKTQQQTKIGACEFLPKDKLQPLTRNCSINPECPYEWKTTNWTPCTKSCGKGIRKRDVACVQEVDTGLVSVNSTACLGEKPESRETCNNHLCHNHWHKGKYSECSNDCGEGERRRDVICLNAHGQKINDSNCSMLKKPREVDRCNGDMCTYKWIKSDWTNCPVDCDDGIQTRTVECHRVADDVVINENICIQNISMAKPKTQRSCKGTFCNGMWYLENWGKCQANGCYKEGKQYRNVYCSYRGRIAKYDPSIRCVTPKPPIERSCIKTKDCPPTWKVMFSSSCNKHCYKIGNLQCIQGNDIVNNSLCVRKVKPNILKECKKTNDCERCAPDGSCLIECNNENDICKINFTEEQKNQLQDLLCEHKCCTCKRFSQTST